MNYANRSILVMSGTKGLGRGVVDAALKAGAHVTATGSNRERLDQMESEANSDNLKTHVTNIFEPNDVTSLLELIDKERFDSVVVNIPGPKPGTVWQLTEYDWRSHADSVLIHPVMIMTRAVKHMMNEGFGRVVSITSTSVRQPIENLVLSNTYRAAFTSFMNSMAKDAAAKGVTLNAAAPGFTWTGRAEQLARVQAEKRGVSVETVVAERNASLPAGRPAEVAEFVAAVMFLLSEDASYVNGITLSVDGGKSLFPF